MGKSCAFLSSLLSLIFGTSGLLMIQLLEVQKHKEKTFQRDLLPFFAKEAQPI